QFDEKLPKYFFNLSIKLSKEGIKLVPIPAKNLDILSKKKHFFIISVVSTLKSCQEYQDLRRKFLDYALLNNRFSIIEVNSFYKFEISNRLQENRSYNFIKLPVSMNSLVNEVTDIYNKRNPIWPGGRKGKLPLLES
ncbi:MAG: hypothetical protein HOJ35_11145, partial [Bdellovibrionales bacterium]|nr:hypothetical protein [Bdellovibrionales bacterium]